MKKVLLGTTALVAAGLTAGAANAAPALKVDVNGYYTGVIASVDSDVASVDDVQIKHEGEISINGSATLDNGMTAGVVINFEATNDLNGRGLLGAGGLPTSAANIGNADGIAGIDEAYAYLEGSFGRVQIGSEASAPFLMHQTAPYFVGSHGVDSPNFGYHSGTQGGSARTATYITLSGDNNKITYFTPKFSGIQLGISYTPDNNCNVDTGGQRGGVSNNFLNTGDCVVGALVAATSSTPIVNTFNLEDIIEIGGTYTGTINNVGVNASIGYATADYEVLVPGTSMSDPEVWSFGLQLNSGAFTLGGGYYMSENVGTPGAGPVSGGKYAEYEEKAWSVALQYVTGPWTLGAGYFTSENETSSVNDDELKVIEVGGTYSLAEGVDVFAVVENYESDSTGPGPLGAAGDSETTAVGLGIDLAF